MHPDDRSKPSLRQQVFSGMGWSLLQTFGSRALSMIIMLVLARVLGPSAFGIVTIAFVILGALTSLVDLGVGDILVRRLPQDQVDYASAFWVVLSFSLAENVALRGASARRGLMRWPAIEGRTRALITDFDVRATGPRDTAATARAITPYSRICSSTWGRISPSSVRTRPVFRSRITTLDCLRSMMSTMRRTIE